MNHESETVTAFRAEASTASYHHADDSGKEWGLAKAAQDRAQAIYDAASDEDKAYIEKIKGTYLISLKVAK